MHSLLRSDVAFKCVDILQLNLKKKEKKKASNEADSPAQAEFYWWCLIQ